MLDDSDFGEFVCDQKEMRKDSGVLAAEPVENFDRFLDLDSARDEKKRAGANESLMQGGKFGRPERGRLSHEIFTKQLGVLDHGALERLKNDATRAQFVGKSIVLEEFIIGEDDASRNRFQGLRPAQNFRALAIG